ncbi:MULTISPECIES: efflux transporter outer membrane subunit [Enterobacteriaceae]|uniref:CusC n=2 Tax=Enterobacteriaceae TaxID=543 RepID=J7FPN1_CITFR|nr:efflux transporter outer membrane subunit [Citrobacter freundii]AFP49028.1 CusC [Citrobacter freundii]AQT23468.1 CusC [Leclercia adecarboxylata]SAI35289.1 RND efflux system%2C outer membrane lipoprotein CmeC [Enterobacter hormaechei]
MTPSSSSLSFGTSATSPLRRPRHLVLFTFFSVALLAGCTLTPDYQRPDAPISAQWPGTVQSTAPSQAIADLPWQDLFADPKLRQIIQMALDNNRDLRIAILNIEKARAQYRIQRADLIPNVSASGSQTAQRTPASVSVAGVGGVTRAYALDVGISSYELDLFGRLRSLNEEALQNFFATEQTRRATHISLIAEIAGNYLTLAADMEQQKLAYNTLQSRQRSYELISEKRQAGNASTVELRQAQSELEDARAQALNADNQVANDRNALELLVGAPLPAKLLPMTGALGSMLAISSIPPGLPSDLLHNRPDILAAEHMLLAANADIGAARAAFFPSISLTASAGRASNDLSALFDHGGRSWSFIPLINLPIFSGGRLTAQLEVSKVQRDIAVAEYEQSIQSAFREVADALAQRAVADGQYAAQQQRADAAKDANDLIELRYQNGVTSYLDVLDSQRTLYSAQQSAIQAKLAQRTNLVTLYKVLGGGWSDQNQANDKNAPSDPTSNGEPRSK